MRSGSAGATMSSVDIEDRKASAKTSRTSGGTADGRNPFAPGGAKWILSITALTVNLLVSPCLATSFSKNPQK